MRNVNIKKTFAVMVVVGLWILGCKGCEKNPVPDEKMDYVGTWTSTEGSSVTIEEDGSCEYEWEEGSHTRSVSGGHARWEGDNFHCWALLDSDFEIEQPPTQEGGQWVMELDGQRLSR